MEPFGEQLTCADGHAYPIVEGTPVMLLDNAVQTLEVVGKSLSVANGNAESKPMPPFYLETLGINDEERNGILEHSGNGNGIDPVVSYLIGATNGFMYRNLIGKLQSYPIPEIRLPRSSGEWLLDIGCNWGRWSLAAAKKGYSVVGVDPSLGAILAARRVSTSLGLDNKYVVADGRYLPFAAKRFDRVFSYSVLQHFAKHDAVLALNEIARVLKPKGKSLVQMANIYGVRSLYHQARRRFKEPQNFEVRYWSLPELRRTFKSTIGDTTINVDCFGGLGIQRSDWRMVSGRLKLVVAASEMLRAISKPLPILRYAADSLYMESRRSA
jgi:2-polyprenyl-3-methyl-5-hydroxy-6-metoxy-1,4-benzoquinol methylase